MQFRQIALTLFELRPGAASFRPHSTQRFFTGHRLSQFMVTANQPGKRFSLTAEQLEAARSERMRQSGHAITQYEDVRTWIEETGLCLYLPRSVQAGFTAPSFVEAIAGQRVTEPHLDLIASADEFLIRLEAEGVAVRLSLNGQPGDQPDYVVASWVLPYVYALRGDRDWRRPPQLTGSRQVSQLAVQVARQLESGNQSAAQLRDALGREVTESAALRALHELWRQLRVIPVVPAPGKAALWQPLRQRFQKAIAEGASTSQVTAISVLASIYLQAVIAASMEDVELFLSALTSRSKIREVVRGLAATRQVHTTTVGQMPLYYVAGTLPEFPAESSYSLAGSSFLHRYQRQAEDQDWSSSEDSVSLAAFAERQGSLRPAASEGAPAEQPTQHREHSRPAPHGGTRPAARTAARPHAGNGSRPASATRNNGRPGGTGRPAGAGHSTGSSRPATDVRRRPAGASAGSAHPAKPAARSARPAAASGRFQKSDKPAGFARKSSDSASSGSRPDRSFGGRKPAGPKAGTGRPGANSSSQRPPARRADGTARPSGPRPAAPRSNGTRNAGPRNGSSSNPRGNGGSRNAAAPRGSAPRGSAPRSSASRRFSLVGASARNAAPKSGSKSRDNAR